MIAPCGENPHFAAGHWRNGALIDSHAYATSPEVWRLLDEAVARSPVKGVILERDENLPPFGDLVDELTHARAIGQIGRTARGDFMSRKAFSARVSRM